MRNAALSIKAMSVVPTHNDYRRLTFDLKNSMRFVGSTGILPATQKGRAFAATSMATRARKAASESWSDDCLRLRILGDIVFDGECSTSKSDIFLGNGRPPTLGLLLDDEEVEEEDDEAEDATDTVGENCIDVVAVGM